MPAAVRSPRCQTAALVNFKCAAAKRNSVSSFVMAGLNPAIHEKPLALY
jgi:hypothetical protein